MSDKQYTGTLPNVGPFSRIGYTSGSRMKEQPKRSTDRHYPTEVIKGKCVRLVPCDVADRF